MLFLLHTSPDATRFCLMRGRRPVPLDWEVGVNTFVGLLRIPLCHCRSLPACSSRFQVDTRCKSNIYRNNQDWIGYLYPDLTQELSKFSLALDLTPETFDNFWRKFAEMAQPQPKFALFPSSWPRYTRPAAVAAGIMIHIN